jgi:hypothetical protein
MKYPVLRGVYINPIYGIAEERTIPDNYASLKATLGTERTYTHGISIRTRRGPLSVRITTGPQDVYAERDEMVSCKDKDGNPMLHGNLFITSDDGEYATSLTPEEVGLVLQRVLFNVIHDKDNADNTYVTVALTKCTPIRMTQP